jgi:desulfoferrodoxin (superoxide reductase-like protein)
MISNYEREHLIKFVKLKQKDQLRKAKLEQQNKVEMKLLRKKAKRIYKIMNCEELI